MVSVEARPRDDAGDFALQLRKLRLQVVAVARVVGAVGSLHREFTHALQRIADLADRAFGRLRQRDGVVGVADRNVHAAHLRIHALCDRQTCSIILGAVDTQARRQALHRGRQRHRRRSHVALCVDREQVGVDGTHDDYSNVGEDECPAPAPDACRLGVAPSAADNHSFGGVATPSGHARRRSGQGWRAALESARSLLTVQPDHVTAIATPLLGISAGFRCHFRASCQVPFGASMRSSCHESTAGAAPPGLHVTRWVSVGAPRA